MKEESIQPMVSVCMITYNHAPYIAQAIEGVLMQKTDFPIELVIGEDCSTDRTREICLEYQRKHPDIIRLLLNDQNIGMMPNFVQTLQACQSKYVALCEGDDYWTDPYKLQKQVEFMEANPEYAGCFGKSTVINARNNGMNYDYPLPPQDTLYLKDILNRHYIPTASFLFRRGMLPEMPDYYREVMSGDIFLETLLIMKGPFRFQDEFFSVYRVHENGITNHPDNLQLGESKLTEMYVYFFQSSNGQNRESFRQAVASRLLYSIHQLRTEPYWTGFKKLLGYLGSILIYFRDAKNIKALLITIFYQLSPFGSGYVFINTAHTLKKLLTARH